MIPSYDDLTPGIPDVLTSESVNQLALFLRTTAAGAVRDTPSAGRTRPSLATGRSVIDDRAAAIDTTSAARERPVPVYACLRSEDGELPPLLAIAQDFSPRVMRVSAHEVLLDVSGLRRLIGEPPAVAAALARAIADAGLAAAARVAIAPTQTAARLLAMADGRWCATAAAAGAPAAAGAAIDLAPLPVTLLQSLETLPAAINHRDRARPYETLERWGIATLGDLAALPPAALSSRLGRRGVALQRLARGLDARPFVPDGDTPRYIGRLELEWPIEALEPLSFVFARLLEPLSAALERADRAAAAIRLDLRLTTRATHSRMLQLPAPMRDARVLRTLLLLDLESHPAPAAIDIVAIELDPAPGRVTQFSLLERALPSPETLSTLTARLAALVGESRVGSAALLDSHRPDAFVMTRFALESDSVSRAARDGTVAATGREGAVSPPPDPACAHPVGATSRTRVNDPVLRRQRHPPAIRVRVEHGRPVYVAAARRGMPQGAVTEAAGPWRTSGCWWALPRPGAPPESCPWSRDEWDVALTSAAVCRIFQDRTTAQWFLDGTYD